MKNKDKQQRQSPTNDTAHTRTTLVLKRFRDLGLSAHEAKSYLSLLQRDTLTVAEVARLAAIPRTNAYEALDKLMTKGMCLSKPGHVKRYSASDPSLLQDELLTKATAAAQAELAQVRKKEKEIIAKYQSGIEVEVAKLKSREKEILEKHQAGRDSELSKLEEKEREIRGKAESVKRDVGNIVAELKPQYESSRLETDPLDFIEVIKDPLQVHKRFMQLVSEAKEEILAFTKPPFSGPRKRLEEQAEPEKKVLRQGIRIRNIYEIPTEKEEIEWRFKDIDGAVKLGEEARVMKKLPMKMVILDRKIVLLALADPVSKRTSLTTQIVEHRDLANSLRMLFDTLWEQAEDYHILEG